MKPRSNGILIGTVLIVLIGALIFVQSQFMTHSEDDGHDHGAETSTNAPGHVPTVDELNNKIPGTGKGPTVSPLQGNGPVPQPVN